MRFAFLAAAVLTTAWAVGAAPPVETVQVKSPRAKVEADDGTGLFLIGQDNYVFAKVGNPKRQVVAYDPVKRRVRISALDRDPMWIQCGYLEPSKNACVAPAAVASGQPSPTATAPAKGFRLATPSPEATAPATKGFRLAAPSGATPRSSAASPARRASTGAVRGGSEAAPAALPDCPGDPRCP